MGTQSTRYPAEVRERAVRLVLEHAGKVAEEGNSLEGIVALRIAKWTEIAHEGMEVAAPLCIPSAAPEDDDRPFGLGQHVAQRVYLLRTGVRRHALIVPRVGDRCHLCLHVLRQCHDNLKSSAQKAASKMEAEI